MKKTITLQYDHGHTGMYVKNVHQNDISAESLFSQLSLDSREGTIFIFWKYCNQKFFKLISARFHLIKIIEVVGGRLKLVALEYVPHSPEKKTTLKDIHITATNTTTITTNYYLLSFFQLLLRILLVIFTVI